MAHLQLQRRQRRSRHTTRGYPPGDSCIHILDAQAIGIEHGEKDTHKAMPGRSCRLLSQILSRVPETSKERFLDGASGVRRELADRYRGSGYNSLSYLSLELALVIQFNFISAELGHLGPGGTQMWTST
jgi:hypothetical protein